MSERVSAALRRDSANPGHVMVSVFVGRNEGARGRAGVLTLRTDEWAELGNLRDGKLVIAFDILEPLDTDNRPHSRACGIRRHDHGPDCAPDCPTCRQATS